MNDDVYSSMPYIKPVSFTEKQKWLKDNIQYDKLVNFALNDWTVIGRLYNHFKEGDW